MIKIIKVVVKLEAGVEAKVRCEVTEEIYRLDHLRVPDHLRLYLILSLVIALDVNRFLLKERVKRSVKNNRFSWNIVRNILENKRMLCFLLY